MHIDPVLPAQNAYLQLAQVHKYLTGHTLQL